MPLSRTHWAYSNAASRTGSRMGGSVALASPTVESTAAVAAQVTANADTLSDRHRSPTIGPLPTGSEAAVVVAIDRLDIGAS